MQHFDAIVVGLGGVGSAAAAQLALRGARVLGLDRFPPAHDRGSSHGRTRIIRQAYFEHPDYVPLLLTAYQLWHELEQASGESLLVPCGLLQVGPRDGAVVRGVLLSAQRHRLAVDSLDAAAVAQRWPGLAMTDEQAAVFEPAAGLLYVERCVLAHLALASRCGSQLHTGETVVDWRSEAAGVVVTTDRDRYAADRLVIAGGPWAQSLLAAPTASPQAPQLPRWEVRRKPQFWYDVGPGNYAAGDGYPGFLFELPEGVFYGFPALDGIPLKVAEHTGGQDVADPLQVDRSLRTVDQQRVEAFLARCLPRAERRLVDHSVCLYTMSPDEHFVVDRLPGHPHVVFAAGLSGHGFKFAPVLGAALADLALAGRTDLPIEFLSLARWR